LDRRDTGTALVAEVTDRQRIAHTPCRATACPINNRRIAMDDRELKSVLIAHHEWLDSGGIEGERADFSGRHLIGADLRNIDLTGALFSDAVLWDAKLGGAVLSEADFTNCNLRGASFVETNLRNATLHNTILIGTDLTGAHMGGASLAGAKCDHAQLGATVLTNLSLTPLLGCQLHHRGASIVDHRSIAWSLGNKRLEDFLVSVGMPRMLAQYTIDCVRALNPKELFSMMQSTFISYGGPDEAFAEKLRDALEDEGVTTFFFKADAVPGRKLHRTMREGVNTYDRMVLICSRESLDRPGVLNEIEETLARESRDGGTEYLIPIALDGYLWDKAEPWTPENPDIKQAILDRVVGDFQGADKNEAKFMHALPSLLDALRNVRIPNVLPWNQ
jgi:hypothetical protein